MKKPYIVILLILASLAFAPALFAQTEPLDGRGKIFHDELLDNLVGNWKLTRTMRGRSVENTVKAEWVLDHQFLQLEMKDTKPRPEYEAKIFIGYDNASERYVAHWIDVFGGRFSETLGYGTLADKHSIKFVFEYPDGPFQNTFTWNAASGTWRFLMRTKDKAGKWTVFGEDILQRQ